MRVAHRDLARGFAAWCGFAADQGIKRQKADVAVRHWLHKEMATAFAELRYKGGM